MKNVIYFLASIFTLIIVFNLNVYSKVIIDSDTISTVAEQVSPSVVNIDTSIEAKEPSVKEKSFNFGGIELHIPNLIQPPQAGTGSGIVVRADGYILTNYHVVKGADKIFVSLKDEEKKHEAQLIAQDSYSDLAIIKINAKNLLPIKFGDSSLLKPGQWVIAIGSPLGFEHTVTFGIISAISRHVGVSFGAAQGAFKYIQTDAAINPGNSGGPLLNLLGEVVGINTFIIGQNTQNLNFAIPSNYAKKISDELINNGSIKHPYLGIKMTTLDDSHIKAEGIPPAVKGIYVIQVVPNSPAFNGGLVAGDVIEKVDGKEVIDPKIISDIVRSKKVGDQLNLKIIRSGEVKSISIIIGNLPDDKGELD